MVLFYIYYKVTKILGRTKIPDSIWDDLVFLHSFPSNPKRFCFGWVDCFRDLDESEDKKDLSYHLDELFDNS